RLPASSTPEITLASNALPSSSNSSTLSESTLSTLDKPGRSPDCSPEFAIEFSGGDDDGLRRVWLRMLWLGFFWAALALPELFLFATALFGTAAFFANFFFADFFFVDFLGLRLRADFVDALRLAAFLAFVFFFFLVAMGQSSTAVGLQPTRSESGTAA